MQWHLFGAFMRSDKLQLGLWTGRGSLPKFTCIVSVSIEQLLLLKPSPPRFHPAGRLRITPHPKSDHLHGPGTSTYLYDNIKDNLHTLLYYAVD